jgi:TolB-like protein/DNA-binding winged helix-turn-helix (wHTH) protein
VAFRVFEFGDFKVDCDRFELSRAGRALKLERKPMELLILLAAGNGHLITRTEIIERLWDSEVFVDTEHGINTAIRKIRQALGDDPENPRFVQTVTGKGYRFIAPIATVEDSSSGDQSRLSPTEAKPLEIGGAAAAPMPNTASPTQSQTVLNASQHSDTMPGNARNSRIILWLAAFGAAVVFACIAISPVGRDLTARFPGLSARPQVRSLAVLPLDNLSGNPSQDYFADGMTDELITMLAKNSTLRVVSRTSVMQYKGVHRPLPEIARALGVDGILEGSISRSGDKVHMTIQLIQASSDTHLWAESYDRDLHDVLKLQGEVAQVIANEVNAKVTPQEQARLAGNRPIDPEAHQAYLEGRYYWNKRTEEGIRKAIGYFHQAIDKDPNYALAYTGLADSYLVLGVYSSAPWQETYRQAEAAATKALEIDDNLAEAHAALAVTRAGERWDLRGALLEFARAIELDPNYATGHQWYAEYLVCLGDSDKAIAEIRRARELDPLSLVINSSYGYILFEAARYDDAVVQARKTLEIDANFYLGHQLLADVYEQRDRFEEAIAEHQKAATLAGETADEAGRRALLLRTAYASDGAKGYWEERLKLAMKDAKQSKDLPYTLSDSSPYELAILNARVGQNEVAIGLLQKAFDQRDYGLYLLKTAPALDGLRSDPRVLSLMLRIGVTPNR